jgi:hypothetical protein
MGQQKSTFLEYLCRKTDELRGFTSVRGAQIVQIAQNGSLPDAIEHYRLTNLSERDFLS